MSATSGSVALVADDLTGAADATAAFVGHGWKGHVVVDAKYLQPPEGGVVQAYDTDSRETSLSGLSEHELAAAYRHLQDADVAFLKIDSLLRGQWPRDVANLVNADHWSRVVIATAAPAHGRALINGRIHANGALFADASIPNRLAAIGLSSVSISTRTLHSDARALDRDKILVVDTTNEHELNLVSAAASSFPTLWVGSAGLARAYARTHAQTSTRDTPKHSHGSQIVVIAGSRTALARRQIEAALENHPALVHVELNDTELRSGSPTSAIPRADAVVVSIAQEQTASRAHDVSLARCLARFAAPLLRARAALILVGGDTARAVCLELGLSGLIVRGELEAGTVLCSDEHGRSVVTKSGSFGDDWTLWRTIEALRAS